MHLCRDCSGMQRVWKKKISQSTPIPADQRMLHELRVMKCTLEHAKATEDANTIVVPFAGTLVVSEGAPINEEDAIPATTIDNDFLTMIRHQFHHSNHCPYFLVQCYPLIMMVIINQKKRSRRVTRIVYNLWTKVWWETKPCFWNTHPLKTQ